MKIYEKVRDRGSRFYGFRVYETNVPEYADRYMFIDMTEGIVYINKGAREGAKVVNLRF